MRSAAVRNGLFPFPLQPDELEEALAMISAGNSRAHVCDWIGCERWQLDNALDDCRAPKLPNLPSAPVDPVDPVVVAFAAGESMGRIAKRLGLTRGQVAGIVYRNRRRLDALGVPCRGYGKGRRGPVALSLLSVLAAGPSEAKALSSASGVPTKFIGSRMDSLVKTGLAVRVSHGGKGRKATYEITADGRDVLRSNSL